MNNIVDGQKVLAAFVFSIQQLLYTDGVMEYTFMEIILERFLNHQTY